MPTLEDSLWLCKGACAIFNSQTAKGTYTTTCVWKEKQVGKVNIPIPYEDQGEGTIEKQLIKQLLPK